MVLSYTIKDIKDEEGDLASLGQGQTAEVKKDATMGEAEARRDATIAAAYAEEQRMAAKLTNDTEIARAKRDFELKKATYDVEVNTAKAEAELAFSLSASKVQARIMEEEMQVKVVERQKEIEIQEQEITRRERELDSKIKKPAEAEQMARKADAWKEYKEAAMVDMMMQIMPKVAAEIGGPISQTKKITMVSTGDGPVGASKVTGEVMEIMASLPETVKSLTR